MEAKTIEQQLAEIFSARRKELGIGYRKVEKRGKIFGASFNYQTVCKLEKGTLRLKPSVLIEIANALDFEIPKELIPEMKRISSSGKVKGEIGTAISQKRMQFEMNQSQFAKLLGVSRETVSYLERGIFQPKLKLLKKINKVLKSVQPPTL